MEIKPTLFPERLKLLRLSRKLSQYALARGIGVTRATVSAWENRRQEPSLEMLARLAKFLGTTVDYLIGVTNTPRPPITPDWFARLPEDLQLRLLAGNAETLVPLFRAADSLAALDAMSAEALKTLIDSLLESKRIHDEYVRRLRGDAAEPPSRESPSPNS